MRFTVSPREDIVIDANVGWRHLSGNATPKNTFAFEAGSDRFTIHGSLQNKDAALLGLSIGKALTKNTRLSLQYDGELGSRERGHEGRLVLEVRW
jgi:subtilase-type serine protease